MSSIRFSDSNAQYVFVDYYHYYQLLRANYFETQIVSQTMNLSNVFLKL